jgi:hypothetical protein
MAGNCLDSQIQPRPTESKAPQRGRGNLGGSVLTQLQPFSILAMPLDHLELQAPDVYAMPKANSSAFPGGPRMGVFCFCYLFVFVGTGV